MKHFFLLSLAAMLSLIPSAHAQFINIRLSYKAVLNPATGQRAQNFTDAQIDQAIAEMNQLHAGYGRGFRFFRVEPIWNVGSLGDATGPSRWYSTDFASATTGLASRDQMDTAARNDSRYVWNNGAINIYLTGGISGGVGSLPGRDIVILGGSIAGNGTAHLRAIARYFNLCNTEGCACIGCGPNPGQCNTPGDDDVWDTMTDLPCWDQNTLANHQLGMNYADLPLLERQWIDRAFFNLMSGRGAGTVLSFVQLNRWTDAASGVRRSVTTGRTWYVNASFGNPCLFQSGYSDCTVLIGGPLGGFLTAIDLANPAGGDVIRVRAFNETDNLPRTYSKPMTWRAELGNSVTLGR